MVTETSTCVQAFMAITRHFIDREWNYREIVLGFEKVWYFAFGGKVERIVWCSSSTNFLSRRWAVRGYSNVGLCGAIWAISIKPSSCSRLRIRNGRFLSTLPPNAKISVALDCRTSTCVQAFMAITRHFIDREWNQHIQGQSASRYGHRGIGQHRAGVRACKICKRSITIPYLLKTKNDLTVIPFPINKVTRDRHKRLHTGTISSNCSTSTQEISWWGASYYPFYLTSKCKDIRKPSSCSRLRIRNGRFNAVRHSICCLPHWSCENVGLGYSTVPP
jgi:hypothetical protein